MCFACVNVTLGGLKWMKWEFLVVHEKIEILHDLELCVIIILTMKSIGKFILNVSKWWCIFESFPFLLLNNSSSLFGWSEGKRVILKPSTLKALYHSRLKHTHLMHSPLLQHNPSFSSSTFNPLKLFRRVSRSVGPSPR